MQIDLSLHMQTLNLFMRLDELLPLITAYQLLDLQINSLLIWTLYN